MSKDSFVLYAGYIEHIEDLTSEEQGQLFMAILRYANGMDPGALKGAVKMAFSFIRAQMDRDSEKYEEKREKRREAGKQGGRPKKEAEEQPAEETQEKNGEKANGFSEKQTKAKKANGFSEKQKKLNDTVSVTDTVTVTDNNDRLIFIQKDDDDSACAREEFNYSFVKWVYGKELADMTQQCIHDMQNAVLPRKINGNDYSADEIRKRASEISMADIGAALSAFERERENVDKEGNYLYTVLFNKPRERAYA